MDGDNLNGGSDANVAATDLFVDVSSEASADPTQTDAATIEVTDQAESTDASAPTSDDPTATLAD